LFVGQDTIAWPAHPSWDRGLARPDPLLPLLPEFLEFFPEFLVEFFPHRDGWDAAIRPRFIDPFLALPRLPQIAREESIRPELFGGCGK